jgi:hypothetical protein
MTQDTSVPSPKGEGTEPGILEIYTDVRFMF